MVEADRSLADESDVVIGVASGYDWKTIEPWVLSLVHCGFAGLGVIIVYEDDPHGTDIEKRCTALGLTVTTVPAESPSSVYNKRFEDIGHALRALADTYRYAIVTDVRDVYFQSDPSVWLEKNLTKPFLAVSEAVRYRDEQWNRKNLLASFPAHEDRVMPEIVNNVGVLAGAVPVVADLCLVISMVARSSGVRIADQSAYNLLLTMEPYLSNTQFAVSEDGFACQAGTLAVPALRPIALEPEPVLDSAGVKTAGGKLYPIVHQYDRISEWKRVLREKLPPLRPATSRVEQLMPGIEPAIDGSPVPRATLVCPTYQRPEMLRRMLEYYRAQRFDGGLELIILDDSPEPCLSTDDVTANEPSIRYFHLPGKRLTVGAKLNLMTQLARGEIIVEFDDDDYYAPYYVQRMVDFLGDADFVTLSKWFICDTARRTFWYWSTDELSSDHFMLSPWDPPRMISTQGWDPSSIDGNLWGYGFSFVWRKSIFPEIEIPDDPAEGLCWDLDFSRRLQSAGFKTLAVPDHEGLVLHMLHPGSSVRMFPQYRMPESMIRTFFPDYPDL
ncbi:glycosyltransferase [Nocardia mexicana]|uniref:Glycosyl transferase family 2 n=1 Tax=Nocardia mexicana TaxID=279262 RepID=A0A370HC76_9NOCA|nr:glycosyltransferase family 2 protein [Nocardia mexicana]RDI54543.1 glycosyl transferase family 2 [Nocardia mexicana]